MGDLFGDIFRGYVAISWTETSIPPEIYLRDLIEFAVWEDYGLIEDLDAFFSVLDARHQPIVEEILSDIVAELGEHAFEYQIERALAHRASFLAEQHLWDSFVECAAALGSRAWHPIVQLAETAAKNDRRALAEAVFAAADQPGFHRDYLRDQSIRLLGVPPKSSVHLRRVK
jgi:hypothetical protein